MKGFKKQFPKDENTNPVAVIFGQIGTVHGEETCYLPIKMTDNGDGTCSQEISVTIDPGTVTIGAVKIEDGNSTRKLEIVADGEDLSLITSGVEGLMALGWDESGDTSRIIRLEQIGTTPKWRALVDATLKDKDGNGITSTDDGGGKQGLDVHVRGGDIQVGAVEIKDGTTDTRTKVKTDGTDDALVVVQNNKISSEDNETSPFDLSGGAFTHTTSFAKKKKIVGIYINISTSLSRNISITMHTANADYTIIAYTASGLQNIIITDQFILESAEEIKLDVSTSVSGLVKYRIDAIDLI